jgi:hypothetical protein
MSSVRDNDAFLCPVRTEQNIKAVRQAFRKDKNPNLLFQLPKVKSDLDSPTFVQLKRQQLLQWKKSRLLYNQHTFHRLQRDDEANKRGLRCKSKDQTRTLFTIKALVSIEMIKYFVGKSNKYFVFHLDDDAI